MLKKEELNTFHFQSIRIISHLSLLPYFKKRDRGLPKASLYLLRSYTLYHF